MENIFFKKKKDKWIKLTLDKQWKQRASVSLAVAQQSLFVDTCNNL